MAGHTQWSEIKHKRRTLRARVPTDYRLHVAFPAHGDAEQESEELLEAFIAAHPEVGPVSFADLETPTIGITFSLPATDAATAWARGVEIINEALAVSALSTRPVISIEVVDSAL